MEGEGEGNPPLIGETLGRRDIIAIGPKEIFLDILGILLPKYSV